MLKTCALLAFLFLGITARAEFTPPPLTGPVVDQAGMMSAGVRTSLAQYLMQVRNHGGPQVQVLVMQSLEGLPIEDASIRVVDQWKLGKAKEDRGVLLLFALSEKRVRIEVGRGLEGDLPDVIAHRIIYDVIVPQLKRGNSDAAVVEGVKAILRYAGKGAADDGEAPPTAGEKMHFPPMLIFKLILLAVIIIMILIPKPPSRRGGGGGGFYGGFLGGGLGGLGGGGGWSSGGGGGWSGGGGGFDGGGSSGGW